MADVPDIWAYVSKGGPDLAGAKVAGFRAGVEKRKVESEIEARAAELANRQTQQDREYGLQEKEFSRRQQEDAQRRKEHQDRIDQDTQRRADILAEKFGPSIVRHPNGDIDVQGSAEAAQERIDLDRKAEALGMQEIMLGKQAGPEFDTVKQFPGYVVGQAKALEKKQQQDALDRRANAAADSRLKAAEIRSGGSGGAVNPDTIEEVNGVPMIRTGKGNLKTLSPDARREYERKKRGASGGTNAAPQIRATVTFDKAGNPVINTTK